MDGRTWLYIHSEGDRRVPQPLRDDLRVDPGLEGSDRVGVAEVVEADAGQTRRLASVANRSANHSGWIGEPSSRVNASPESG